MRKSILYISSTTLLSTVALSQLAAAQIRAKKQTNVVVINLDDAGYGDFSYNGALGYKTPTIDSLASSGIRFTHFLAVQATSGASRAGLLTGCYPNRIGMEGAPNPNSPYGINPNEMTLAELVKQKGYATAIFGKWHLGDYHTFMPLQNGFDEYYGIPYSNDMWPFHPQLDIFGDIPTIRGNEVVGLNTDQSQFTEDFTDCAIDFIKRNKNNPFLLYLAHPMPHVPLAVSSKFRGKSEQGMYGDVMMELDWNINRLLSTLRELNLEENTIIILTSDNGPWISYGNHAGSTNGLREGKGTSFEGGNRVPCVISWKGITKPGVTCNSLISNIDIFPTIAEITGASLPQNKIDGVSILPIIKGDASANPRADFAYYYDANSLQAVTDGMFKLVFPHTHRSYEVYPPANDGGAGKVDSKHPFKEIALYDLRRDPGERYNVINEHPHIVNKLMKIADKYRSELGDDLNGIEGFNRRSPGYRRDYE